MTTRSYKEAIDCLNTLQSNTATLQAARDSGGRLAEFAMHETEEYLSRIGYLPEDLNKLNVLHVTGTKGKGSTCAFADSILRRCMPHWTVGLYTSPHLVAVRERIRINGEPISEKDFAKYFFEVWDRLEANSLRRYETTSPKPMYFRMVTIVAFHAFCSLKVDATVLEVGVGGMYDCTNIVPKPIVTGISALGIDHVAVLGKTLAEIAWQKGGIYKKGVPAYTVNQPPEGFTVLERQAMDRGASSFTVVPLTPSLSDIQLGLAGSHQYQNANLAIHLVRNFLQVQAPASQSNASDDTLPEPFVEGLRTAKWPGRCQTVRDPLHEGTTWFLDGAHTVDSLECCVQWFVSPTVALRIKSNAEKSTTRILIFNCTNGRNGVSFLGTILSKTNSQLLLHAEKDEQNAKELFDHVIFCSNVTYADGGFKGDLTSLVTAESNNLAVQRELSAAWSTLAPEFPPENIHVLPSIEHAVTVVRDLENHGMLVDVLVTGSLHLIGGTIEVAGLSNVAL
ncbi:FolC bifunctional protein [Rickenella mellea]|uniref:Folylpolyglutamate synthase n=1 Tax=Rickenella mellea TaxID=50990 RepID=A0A4R5XGA9_9AGAM|nr:FolC bifunctional protein [Rickenella mellea]